MIATFFILAFAADSPSSDQGGPHHHGFFLRADLGFGYYSSSAPQTPDNGATRLDGLGAGLGISIGGSIAENLALYGSLFDAAVTNPTVHSGGYTTSTNNASASIAGIGIGLAYYFMPANLFIDGTVGAGPLTVSNGNVEGRTNYGLVARIGFGKEWFVSESWGLGIAAHLNLGLNKDSGDSPGPPATWRTWSPLISFSATFY